MHASPSNSEKVCDVKLLCFVTKTVCMSKQNNSDLDYTFKRYGPVPSFFFILPFITASWTTSRVPINLWRFFFSIFLLCQFVFCFVINTILSNKTHVMQKWFQRYLFLWFFLSLSIKLFLFLDSPYLGILYFIQYCFSSFLKKDK